jgi:Ca2+-binding RTX toxin-like protein
MGALATSISGTNGNDTLAARFDGDKVFGLGGNDILTSRFTTPSFSAAGGHDQFETFVNLRTSSTERCKPPPGRTAAQATTVSP